MVGRSVYKEDQSAKASWSTTIMVSQSVAVILAAMVGDCRQVGWHCGSAGVDNWTPGGRLTHGCRCCCCSDRVLIDLR